MSAETGPPKPPAPSIAQRAWWLFEILNVRLRFIFLMVLVGLVVGYWDNITNHVDRWLRPARAPEVAPGEQIEYYCPMHPNVIRSEPGNCPICGMPLSKRSKSAQGVLPEGVLARTELTPLKVRMGRIGTTPVEYRLLSREIRTVGIVDYDETRRAFIAARIKGRVDKLMVNYVGQYVKEGDPLVWIYSPELLTAQQELLVTHQQLSLSHEPGGLGETTSRSIYEAARQKLLLLGITSEQLDQILQRGTPETHLTIYSPISGFVTEKKVLEGHYVNEGDDLYTVADLSRVWMQAKVFESESAGVEIGTAVEVTCTAFPSELFAGRITFIAYEVDPATRTVAARVDIANPDFKLKPGMYAQAVIRVPVGKVTEIEPPAATAATSSQSTEPAPASTDHVTKAYLALTAAYAQDRIDPTAVAELVKQAKALAAETHGAVSLHAGAVADEAAKLADKDLAAQRGALKTLSAQMIKLLRAQPAGRLLYVAHCPMVDADWVQDSDAILNPYMGREMPKCGVVTETVKPTAIVQDERYATGYFCPITPNRLYEKPELCPIDKFPFKYVKVEKVLAAPAAAVIDTGTRHIVYRESAPGVFDMLAVEVAPRTGEFYPVLGGVQAGERVATEGAFLVDAENRLNPAAAAQYFGASGGPQSGGSPGGHQH
jgi:multidrug efflux pump subunit AcrA (membrane-fusion protein)